MSGEIREARAAIAQALQGLTMNDQPVNVYSDYPRQWALPALAVGPASGDYVVQERLGAARVNLTVIAATTPANNAADLAALEDMAVLVRSATVTADSKPDVHGPGQRGGHDFSRFAHITLDRSKNGRPTSTREATATRQSLLARTVCL